MAEEVLRAIVLALIRRGTPYPARWTDDKTSRGDFDGRDSSIEIFNVAAIEQRELRRSLREIHRAAEKILERRIILLFHTPEATARYYRDLLVGLSRINNATLQSSLELSVHGRLSDLFTVSIRPSLKMPLGAAA